MLVLAWKILLAQWTNFEVRTRLTRTQHYATVIDSFLVTDFKRFDDVVETETNTEMM